MMLRLGCPAEPILLEILEFILYLLDKSDCLKFLMRMSGLEMRLGEPPCELTPLASFFSALVIDSPLIIFGDAIVRTGDEALSV